MNYKKNLLIALIAIAIVSLMGCPDVSGTNENNSDKTDGQNIPDVLTIQNNSILISEGTESGDGVTYTVKSYATVYADCEYLYDYYRLYCLNNKVRKIVYVPHSMNIVGYNVNFDFTYKEIDKNERYLNYTEQCFIWIYSESGKVIEAGTYCAGKITSVTQYYESGKRKSGTYFETSSIGEKTYHTDYYNDDADNKMKARFDYSLTKGSVRSYTYYYPSGYCRCYYNGSYYYEYDDEVTTSYGDSGYKSKIAYNDTEVLTKFEQLIGEKVYMTSEPDQTYTANLISFTVVLNDVTTDAAAVALYCNVNDYKADNVNGSSVYIADVVNGKATWTITSYPAEIPFSFQFVPLPGRNTSMGDDWWSCAISGSSQYNNNRNNITCDFISRNKGDGSTITVNLDYYEYDGHDYWSYGGENRTSFPIYGISSTRWFNEDYQSCFTIN